MSCPGAQPAIGIWACRCNRRPAIDTVTNQFCPICGQFCQYQLPFPTNLCGTGNSETVIYSLQFEIYSDRYHNFGSGGCEGKFSYMAKKMAYTGFFFYSGSADSDDGGGVTCFACGLVPHDLQKETVYA